MTSLRPYLIRAIYEWITENGLTPYILVDATHEGAIVPQQFVQDGKIVLNLRPEAIQGLLIGNSEVEFGARFGGTPMQVIAPIAAILAIYAKENGKGMVFDDDDDLQPPPSDDSAESASDSSGHKENKKRSKPPFLKVVK